MSTLLVIDCGSPKTPDIVIHLKEFGYQVNIVEMNELSEEHLRDISGVVIGGSPIEWEDIDPKTILDKFRWLSDFDKPVLGICFGHQIIGLIFGGTISRDIMITNDEKIDFSDDELLAELCDCTFCESHINAVTVPEAFQLLGTSCSCYNEAMRHKKRPIWGVQFHPETSGEQGRQLLKNFTDVCANGSE